MSATNASSSHFSDGALERIASSTIVALNLGRELLYALAFKFGSNNPNAAETELVEFLYERAREYHALKVRLDSIADSDHQLSNILLAAKAALHLGKFDEAESLLSVAEARVEERTLDAIRSRADIRVARGDAAVLSGNAELGFEHFERAASFFRFFDRNEEVDRRLTLGLKLLFCPYTDYEKSSQLAKEFLKPALEASQVGSLNWAKANYYIGKCTSILDGFSVSAPLKRDFDRAVSAMEMYDRAFAVINTSEVELWIGLNQDYSRALTMIGRFHHFTGKHNHFAAAMEKAILYNEAAISALNQKLINNHWLSSRQYTANILFYLGFFVRSPKKRGYLLRCRAYLEEIFHQRDKSNHIRWLIMTELYVRCSITLMRQSSPSERELIYEQTALRLRCEEDLFKGNADYRRSLARSWNQLQSAIG